MSQVILYCVTDFKSLLVLVDKNCEVCGNVANDKATFNIFNMIVNSPNIDLSQELNESGTD